MIRRASLEEVMSVVSHHDIWPRIIGGYKLSPEDFAPPKDWLYMTETGKEALILDGRLRIHPNFLPEVRHKAYYVIRRWLKHLFSLGFDRVFAKIDAIHNNAVGMARAIGMKLYDEKNNTLFFRIDSHEFC